MKTEILLTFQFDPEAQLLSGWPGFRITPERLLADVNEWLRTLLGNNPYGLENPDHIGLKLAIQSARPPSPAPWPAEKLIADLDRVAADLKSLQLACQALHRYE